MNIVSLRALPFVLVIGCATTSAPKAPEPAPKVPAIAVVNGVEIPKARFDRELEQVVARGSDIPADRLARIAANIVKRMVEQELIDQAVKRAGVVPSEAAIAEGWDEYRGRFQSEQQFQAYLTLGKVTRETITGRIRDRLALELLLGARMAVSREECLAFYEANERFYRVSAGIRASHILIKVGLDEPASAVAVAYARIKNAQEALAAGEDFASVADRLSEGDTEGGDLGFFSSGRMVQEFEDVAFAMKVGEVSAPVRTRFGLHIIKLTDRRVDHIKPFEEVADQIRKSLQNKAFFTERRRLLAELQDKATVETYLPPELTPPPDNYDNEEAPPE